MAKTTKEPSFEEAMKRLEETVEQMESRDLPLDEVIGKYEEGMKLVSFCEKRLEAAEKKIELLMKSKTGDVEVSDLKANELPSEENDKGQVRLF